MEPVALSSDNIFLYNDQPLSSLINRYLSSPRRERNRASEIYSRIPPAFRDKFSGVRARNRIGGPAYANYSGRIYPGIPGSRSNSRGSSRKPTPEIPSGVSRAAAGRNDLNIRKSRICRASKNSITGLSWSSVGVGPPSRSQSTTRRGYSRGTGARRRRRRQEGGTRNTKNSITRRILEAGIEETGDGTGMSIYPVVRGTNGATVEITEARCARATIGAA